MSGLSVDTVSFHVPNLCLKQQVDATVTGRPFHPEALQRQRFQSTPTNADALPPQNFKRARSFPPLIAETKSTIPTERRTCCDSASRAFLPGPLSLFSFLS